MPRVVISSCYLVDYIILKPFASSHTPYTELFLLDINIAGSIFSIFSLLLSNSSVFRVQVYLFIRL